MTDWKHDGVRVIPAGSLDTNTAQTPGMNRAAAINFARVGAQKLWAGTVTIHAHAKTGAHHHGHLESVIYVVKGKARMRWGERLEFVAEAGPGDFIYIPPYVPHQEVNASADETLECVLVRSDGEAVAVNLDIEIDGDRFAIGAHQHAFQRLVRAGVDLLVRHIGRDVDEVAGPRLGDEFEPLAPAHPRLALHDIDDALEMAVM